MGGGSKASGKGGGGARQNRNGRNCNPEQRPTLSKDPGVPGNELRRAGAALMKTKQGKQRHVMNIPSLNKPATGSASAVAHPPQHDEYHDPQEEGTTDAQQTDVQRNVSEMAAFALRCSRQQAQYQAPAMLLGGESSATGGMLDVGGYINEEELNRRRNNDQSLRKFYKEFQKVVESSDVLLEVLDARDPLGCRLLQMEKTIQSQWGDKKTVVVVLNKADLVSEMVLDAWIRYFASEGLEAISFTASRETAHATARNLCISKLFGLLRRIARGESGARKSITVGTIGYPNVGKSSIINALKRRNVVGVANTPGFTTGNTEVGLRNDVRIIDCPGVVMPGEDSGDVVLRNAAKVEDLANPHVAVERLISRCDPQQLSAVYSIGDFHEDAVEFVKQVGIRRGRLRHGGVVDEDETARMILHDWNDGRIGYYTLPPDDDPMSRATLKSSGNNDHDDDDRGARVVAIGLSGTDLQAERLPTFHLSAVEPIGERKRLATHHRDEDDEEADEDEDEDVIEDSEEDEASRRQRLRKKNRHR